MWATRPILLVLTCALAHPLSAQEERVEALRRAAISELSSTDFATRQQAVDKIQQLDRDRRGGDVIRAVAAELSRLQQSPSFGMSEVPGPDRMPGWDYYMALVDIAAESRDAVVLPSLVRAIDTGNIATDAVAEFGESAVAPVLVAMSQRTGEVIFQADGLRVFIKMLNRNAALSEASRAAITRSVNGFLSGSQSFIVVRQALLAAAALEDPLLLPAARRVSTATNAAQAGLTLSGLGNFDELRRLARSAERAIENRDTMSPGPSR